MADEMAVVGGVDTHTDFHQAAVIDSIGRHLATEAFPTTVSAGCSAATPCAGSGRLPGRSSVDRGGKGGERHPICAATGVSLAIPSPG
jgi:hypothetical protein